MGDDIRPGTGRADVFDGVTVTVDAVSAEHQKDAAHCRQQRGVGLPVVEGSGGKLRDGAILLLVVFEEQGGDSTDRNMRLALDWNFPSHCAKALATALAMDASPRNHKSALLRRCWW